MTDFNSVLKLVMIDIFAIEYIDRDFNSIDKEVKYSRGGTYVTLKLHARMIQLKD